MIDKGLVKGASGKHATVKVDKKDECSKCGMCLFPKNANSVDFYAENTVGAKEGDTVLIDISGGGKLLGAILVFLIPLILIGVSALINHFFIKVEIWTLILSVIFIILWYTILAVIDKKLKKSSLFCSKIVRVLKEKENDE